MEPIGGEREGLHGQPLHHRAPHLDHLPVARQPRARQGRQPADLDRLHPRALGGEPPDGAPGGAGDRRVHRDGPPRECEELALLRPGPDPDPAPLLPNRIDRGLRPRVGGRSRVALLRDGAQPQGLCALGRLRRRGAERPALPADPCRAEPDHQ